MICTFLNLLRFVLWFRILLILVHASVHLQKTCISLLMSEVFYKGLLGQVSFRILIIEFCSYLNYFLSSLYLGFHLIFQVTNQIIYLRPPFFFNVVSLFNAKSPPLTTTKHISQRSKNLFFTQKFTKKISQQLYFNSKNTGNYSIAFQQVNG